VKDDYEEYLVKSTNYEEPW